MQDRLLDHPHARRKLPEDVFVRRHELAVPHDRVPRQRFTRRLPARIVGCTLPPLMAAQLTPVSARDQLVHVLAEDLIGPAVGSLHATETFTAAPSR